MDENKRTESEAIEYFRKQNEKKEAPPESGISQSVYQPEPKVLKAILTRDFHG